MGNRSHRGPRELKYRGQVRLAARLQLFMVGYWILAGAAVFFFSRKSLHVGLWGALFAAAITWIPALLIGVRYLRVTRPMATSRIEVHPDRIVIRSSRGMEAILFTEIVAVRSKIHRLPGVIPGWVALQLRSGRRHRFTVALERCEYVIEGVHRARPDLLPTSEFVKLRSALVLADHSLARAYEAHLQWRRPLALGIVFALPLVGAFAVTRLQALEFVIHLEFVHVFRLFFWGALAAVLARSALLYLAGRKFDVATLQRMALNPRDKRRDVAEERAWLARRSWAIPAVLVVLYAGVYATDLNFIQTVRMRSDDSRFEFRKDESFWVDGRFNCVECAHALQKGDAVVSRFGWMGAIIGLPGETVAFNRETSDHPYVDARELKLPGDAVAIQVLDRGRLLTRVTPLWGLKGLVSRKFPGEYRPAPFPLQPSIAVLPPRFDGNPFAECAFAAVERVRSWELPPGVNEKDSVETPRDVQSQELMDAAMSMMMRQLEEVQCTAAYEVLKSGTVLAARFDLAGDRIGVMRFFARGLIDQAKALPVGEGALRVPASESPHSK